MTRPTPRRPSRTTTPKPRKIAGRDEAEPTGTKPAAPSSSAGRAPAEPAPPLGPPRPPRRPVAKDPGPDDGKGLAEGGTSLTSTLLAVVGVLVLVLVAQCAWFLWNNLRDEKVAAGASAAESSGSDESDDNAPISVPSGRPVVLNELAVQGGVDAAASAAEVMFARNWKTYDKSVDNAVAVMTDSFAEEFRATTDDVRQEFIAEKTDVQVRVVAQSVVRANDTELEALIFLNQYIVRGEGDDAKTTYTPYRALLRMVHTDRGWLVDGLDTK